MKRLIQKIIGSIIIILCLMLTSCEDTSCDINGDGRVGVVEERICEQGDSEKPTKQQPSKEYEINLPQEGEYTINTALISIHMEAGSNPSTTDYPALHWTDLINLIALADEYNVKLSLV